MKQDAVRRMSTAIMRRVTPEQLEASWRVNAFGAFLCAAQRAPEMFLKDIWALLKGVSPQTDLY
jgi:hypothetical protein